MGMPMEPTVVPIRDTRFHTFISLSDVIIHMEDDEDARAQERADEAGRDQLDLTPKMLTTPRLTAADLYALKEALDAQYVGCASQQEWASPDGMGILCMRRPDAVTNANRVDHYGYPLE